MGNRGISFFRRPTDDPCGGPTSPTPSNSNPSSPTLTSPPTTSPTIAPIDPDDDYDPDATYTLGLAGQTLEGPQQGSHYGISVQITSNGQYLAVGASEFSAVEGVENQCCSGTVMVYEKESFRYERHGQSLFGAQPETRAGQFVSLSDDGKMLAVTAKDVVTTYRYGSDDSQPMEWNEEQSIAILMNAHLSNDGDRLVGNTPSKISLMGYREDRDPRWKPLAPAVNGVKQAVLSGDGTRVFVVRNNREISVYDFDRDNNSLLQKGQIIDLGVDNSRVVVAATTKGNIFAVGFNNIVRAFIYQADTYLWAQYGNDMMGLFADYGGFGYSLSISSSGYRLIVGSPRYGAREGDNRGRSVIFQYYDGEWLNFAIPVMGEVSGATGGFGVSISPDANWVAVGSPFIGLKRRFGNVRVYRIRKEEASSRSTGGGAVTTASSTMSATIETITTQKRQKKESDNNLSFPAGDVNFFTKMRNKILNRFGF